MKNTFTLKWAVVFILTCIEMAAANVKLPVIFDDSMVLQQESPVTIWGWAQPGETIDVKGSWQGLENSARTNTGSDGNWHVCIKTPKAGGPYTLSVQGRNTIVLNDVLVGEVWVCSGQSNMKLSLDGFGTDKVMQDAIDTANYPNIRQFFVPRMVSARPQSDCKGQWEVCTPKTAGSFCAVGFYFGRELHQKLNVPIGLIYTSWGGTSAEAWTNKETLLNFEAFRKTVEQLDNLQDKVIDNDNYSKAVQEWEQKLAKIDPGTKENWQNPSLDDADWKTMELPSPWTGTELSKVDGIIWFRRVINLPPSWTGSDLELHLGLIDDIDNTWFNGIRVGTTLEWMNDRIYRIPASALHEGPNVIAIRVIDPRRGEGGFTSQKDDMRIGRIGADTKTGISITGPWKYKFGSPTPIPDVPRSEAQKKLNQYTPTSLYNAMIHPLIPFRVAGAIWYQGESNCYNPILYRTLFPAMISGWRSQWGQGDFPFYYVQIAPYQYGDKVYSQAIREAQLMALDKVPNVGMAVLMDIGEEKDIHPVNKLDVGKRLSLWALAKTYGFKDVVYSGPLYKGMKIEQDSIRISFNYTDGGLMAKGGPLTDFTIAGEDQKFVPARAVIDGNSVVVSSPDIKNPAAVRYAWSNWVSPNLFNTAGLPASSFRTDDWPLQ